MHRRHRSVRTRLCLLVLIPALVTAPFLGVARAVDGIGLRVTLGVPAAFTLGHGQVPASLALLNRSIQLGPLTVTRITVNPSCGDALCQRPDPGVFRLSRHATGSGGCAGRSFDVVGPDRRGAYAFKPSALVVLRPPPAAGRLCRIAFGLDALKPPSIDADPSTNGLQTVTVATAGAFSELTGSGRPAGVDRQAVVTTVAKAASVVTAHASRATAIGGAISDTAVVAGGYRPTGTMTFRLYGPGDSTCLRPLSTTPTPVEGIGVYHSGPFVATTPGTYRFLASYSGDANNLAAADSCTGSAQEVPVMGIAPALAVRSIGGSVVGQALALVGEIAGGFRPTGRLTFRVFGPGDPGCAARPLFTSVSSVSGPGAYRSSGFVPTVPGTYHYTATYSGDASNPGTAGDCTTDATFTKAAVSLLGRVTDTVPVGGPVAYQAILARGLSPGGALTFTFYGPGDSTCGQPPVFRVTRPVSGNGAYSAASFNPLIAGVYRYVVSFSGDLSNAAASATCLGARQLIVTAATTVLTERAEGEPALGGAITDMATLTGYAPTGTLTFRLYGPGDPMCATQALATYTSPVKGNGNYASGAFTTTAAGSYRFVASYSGDRSNRPAAGTCAIGGGLVVGAARGNHAAGAPPKLARALLGSIAALPKTVVALVSRALDNPAAVGVWSLAIVIAALLLASIRRQRRAPVGGPRHRRPASHARPPM